MPAPPIAAVAFDAFGTLFDVHAVTACADNMFPGRGAALSQLWRSKQIEYTFLRTLSQRYRNFEVVTAEALHFAAHALHLPLDDAGAERLMAQYACLAPFPENGAALRALRELGIPLAILSNGTPAMIAACVASAGFDGLFEHILSVDTVQQFKTTDAAYQLAPDAFQVPPSNILFVSANGWDAAGATWFGFTTFWINRSGQPRECLGVEPSMEGTRLTEVVDFVRARHPADHRP